MKKIKAPHRLRNVPLAFIHGAVAVMCALVPLCLVIISVWRSAADFIESTYSVSLTAAVSSMRVKETFDADECAQAVLDRLDALDSSLDFTYYILDSSDSAVAYGHNQVYAVPLDTRYLPQAGSYLYYNSQYRGRILAIRAALTSRYDLVVLFSVSSFCSVADVFGGDILFCIPVNLAILALGLWILWRYQLAPARALVSAMRNPLLDHPISTYATWKNEIGQMYAAYQDRHKEYLQSLEKIRQLSDTRWQSELDALQNQINAHFIYNTLNNIQWLAAASRADDVIMTARSLDTLLRGLSKNDLDLVRLEDEIAYTEAYLSAQKIRFRDLFDYEFQIDPLLLMCMVPKFILQPIVENSLYHGFLEADRKGGHVLVSICRRGYRIVITVQDDGCGIPEQRICEVLRNTQKSSNRYMGVAIGNIDRRIRLLCGREYGIGITSKYNSFTRVEITLPYPE